MLAGVSCRTSENPLSWRDILPLAPLFHYSNESGAGVDKGEKVRLHRIGGRKGSDGDHIRIKENSRGWERDSRGPEHHADEDEKVPVMLDQGIELSVAA